MYRPYLTTIVQSRHKNALQQGEHEVKCVATLHLEMPLLYHAPQPGRLRLQRSNDMGNAARCVKVLAQVFEGVNMLHCEAIACESSGHWSRLSDRRLGDHHHLCFCHVNLHV